MNETRQSSLLREKSAGLARRITILLALHSLLTACIVGCGRPAVSRYDDGVVHYADREALKDCVPFASEWWEVSAHGRTFIVCLQEFPSYGQSREDVHVWREGADGSLSIVWSFRTEGIGPVGVEIDKEKGIVSVRALANTDLQGSVIAFVHLGASRG